jgi:hypothetical protein
VTKTLASLLLCPLPLPTLLSFKILGFMLKSYCSVPSFGGASKQLQNLLHAKLACTALATFDGLIGELALLFLEVENSLFDAVFDSDLVDYYVDLLGKTMYSIDGLLFDKLAGLLVEVT